MICVQALTRREGMRFWLPGSYILPGTSLLSLSYVTFGCGFFSFKKLIFCICISELNSLHRFSCMIFYHMIFDGEGRRGGDVSASDHIRNTMHSWQVVPSGMHSSIRRIICHSESFELWRGRNHLWKDILQLMIQEVWGRLFFEGYKGHNLRRNNWSWLFY